MTRSLSNETPESPDASPRRFRIRRELRTILILGLCVVQAGCAATVRMYPSRSDPQRSIHEALLMIEPDAKVTIRMHDGSEAKGRFLGISGGPDLVVLLGKSELDSLQLADIEYIGESRGWTKQGQVVIAGLFLTMVAVALTSEPSNWGPR